MSADISPQFVIGGDWMKFPIHLTPRYKVRIFRENLAAGDSSLPVRTPSFMPGGTIYIPLKVYKANQLRLSYFSFSFFHHSNGQDGSEVNPDGTLNTYNGNFSTNFVEPAFFLRFRCDRPRSIDWTISGYRDLYFRFGFERHFSTALALVPSYGSNRLNLSVGGIDVKAYRDKILGEQYKDEYLREKQRLVFNSTLIFGSRSGVLNDFQRRINLGIDYHLRIRGSSNSAFFVGAGYYGSDSYNIYYEQSYFYIRAGISLGFFVTPNMIGLR